MNDSHLFKVARKMTEQADYTGCSGVKIGCVIAYKGAILAKGYNTNKTHPRQNYYNKWRYNVMESTHYLPAKNHAEQMCLSKIKNLDIDYKKVHVYIYREYKNGKLALARPCPSCLAALRDMGIRHIHFTTDDGYCHEVMEY